MEFARQLTADLVRRSTRPCRHHTRSVIAGAFGRVHCLPDPIGSDRGGQKPYACCVSDGIGQGRHNRVVRRLAHRLGPERTEPIRRVGEQHLGHRHISAGWNMIGAQRATADQPGVVDNYRLVRSRRRIGRSVSSPARNPAHQPVSMDGIARLPRTVRGNVGSYALALQSTAAAGHILALPQACQLRLSHRLPVDIRGDAWR